MPDREIPDRPSLVQYKKQSKELLRACLSADPAALERMRSHHPKLRGGGAAAPESMGLADAQLVLAREHGFESWPKFAKHIEMLEMIRAVDALASPLADPVAAFLEVACVPRHGWHGSGSLEHAQLILERYPDVAGANIYTAAVLGDESAVRSFLAADGGSATAKGGAHEWDALTYLCFSRYLRLDPARPFAETARALLEAGANANTGWTEWIDDPPRPVPETAIYGAAGIARHAKLTRVLLEFGADPNDEETPYHVPESDDNTVMQVLLESGRLNERSLAWLAVRKCDWHDSDGLRLILEAGGNPNYGTHWRTTPLQHGIRRDNSLEMIELMLDFGGDPAVKNEQDDLSAAALAARRGRGDFLEACVRRELPLQLTAVDTLIAACARGVAAEVRRIAEHHPEWVQELRGMGGTLLAQFAGNGNLEGVRCLLELGVPVNARYIEGDGYFGVAKDSTALHVAAWRARHRVVRELILRGASVSARDGDGRTPLQMAVKACIDSFWKAYRKPNSVAALLAAGASAEGVEVPTGYDAIDELLTRRR